jgi:hypothetical protein
MHRTLITLCLALAWPAWAQTPSNKPTKIPEVKKLTSEANAGKGIKNLLSRDELRACLKRNEDNKAEEGILDKEKAAYHMARLEVVARKDVLVKQMGELDVESASIKAEQTELLTLRKELEKPVDKADIAAADVRRNVFNDRVQSNEKRVAYYNASKQSYTQRKAVLEADIEASNVRSKTLVSREEALNQSSENWRVECGSRPFLETDEAAVKKGL